MSDKMNLSVNVGYVDVDGKQMHGVILSPCATRTEALELAEIVLKYISTSVDLAVFMLSHRGDHNATESGATDTGESASDS